MPRTHMARKRLMKAINEMLDNENMVCAVGKDWVFISCAPDEEIEALVWEANKIEVIDDANA